MIGFEGKFSIQWAIFDLDSTLIQQETIDELARRAGVYEDVARITEEAMAGGIDFESSLRLRCTYLRGLDRSVWRCLLDEIVYTEGALELFKLFQSKGVKTAIVSGGFMEMVEHVGKFLGADCVLANRLEYSAEDKLTGNLLGDIVDGNKKQEFLLRLSSGDAMAVGDGSNDIPMLKAAKVSIAFMGKPAVKKAAMHSIDTPSFRPLVEILTDQLN